MATIAQIQRGCARFLDTHISGAFDGWQKAVVVGGGTLLIANLPALAETYGNHPMVAALGVYKDGNIDIDALYNAFVPNMGIDKIPINIPKVAQIKLGKEDFDTLYKYIKEA